jgi:methyltransferase (TIGR00027 family)
MKERKASAGAEGTAAIRACESTKPEHLQVCYDPLAKVFLSTTHRAILKVPFLAKAVLWFLTERRVPGVVGDVVVRTKFIDDYLEHCIDGGILQLVILGAGYDSRAYRIEGLKGKVKVFEVDHPATQKLKIEKLKKLLGSMPGHVVHVPIDFNREKLDQSLFESGYNRNLKTLFIWEGVTYYLTAQAVDETLAFVVNNSGPGSSIILNYMYDSAVDGTCELEVARKHRDLVAKVGEPFTFGIKEGTIEEFLSNRGFYQVTNVSTEFLKGVYLKEENRKRKLLPHQPLVHATVKPRQ